MEKRAQYLILPLMLSALFSGSLHAETGKIYTPSRERTYSAEELAAEKRKREAVFKHTEELMTLLGAEIALNKGDSAQALRMYLAILQKSRRSEVAERAMELAVGARAYPLADLIYQKWIEIEPDSGPAQRRITWIRYMATGKEHTAMEMLPQVLSEADDSQRSPIFFILTEFAYQSDSALKPYQDIIIKETQKYRELPEALITEALFNTLQGKERRAVAALNRLIKLDPQLSQTPEHTQEALKTLIRKYPDTATAFFRQADTDNTALVWREMEVSHLIETGKFQEAETKIDRLLNEDPDPLRYLLAARVAMQNLNQPAIANYLEKAYQTGTQEQKSLAAVTAAMHFASQKNYTKASEWTDKVEAPSFIFDRDIMRASLALDTQNWEQAYQLAKTIRNTGTGGRFFDHITADKIYLHALSQHLAPQQAERELSELLLSAQKKSDSRHRELRKAALYQRGMLYINTDVLDKTEQGINDLTAYLKSEPDNPIVQNSLGYTLLEQRPEQLDEAFRLIQDAHRQLPENAAVNDSLGWAYYKKGNHTAALRYLEYAHSMDTDPEIAAHLGEVYWEEGKPEKARKIWREAWDKNKEHKILLQTLRRYGIDFMQTDK